MIDFIYYMELFLCGAVFFMWIFLIAFLSFYLIKGTADIDIVVGSILTLMLLCSFIFWGILKFKRNI